MLTSKRQRYIARHQALKSQRSPFFTDWQKISEYMLPFRSRFVLQDRSRVKSHLSDKIINSTGNDAIKTVSAGMLAGLTSPARPWFRIATRDPEAMKDQEVRAWLEVVEQRMRDVFHRSNIYNVLPQIYEDLPAYGTAVMLVEQDDAEVIHCHVLPVGSYCLATNGTGRVAAMYRECLYTVEQAMERWPNTVSLSTRARYESGDLDGFVECLHVIESNTGSYMPQMIGSYPFRSCWVELTSGNYDELLSENGYYEMPFLSPRWSTNGEDVYGTGPGHAALGDVKSLQSLERRAALAMEKVVNPPMTGPASLASGNPSMLPGSLTTVTASGAGDRYQAAHTVDPRALAVRDEIARHEHRIRRAFRADLFMMLTDSDRRQITAREIDERREEKLMQLGPELEHLNDELLDPLIDRTFGVMLRAGLIDPPPESLRGADLKIEYISIMAQAQKLVTTAAVERLVGFSTAIAQIQPSALDRLNGDETLAHYADLLGVSTKLVRTEEEVEKIREEQAQQRAVQQAAQLAPAAKQGAEAVKALGETPTANNSALSQILGNQAAA